jgi:hypothetical protein
VCTLSLSGTVVVEDKNADNATAETSDISRDVYVRRAGIADEYTTEDTFNLDTYTENLYNLPPIQQQSSLAVLREHAKTQQVLRVTIAL